MNYTKNESKAIQQFAAAAVKNTSIQGFWACDGKNLFTVGANYNLSTPCESSGAWVIPARSYLDAVKGTKELSIDFDKDANTININGCKFAAMAFDDAKNILNDSEQPINKGFYRIDRTNDELLDAADFVSTDKTRFNLTGVFVDSGISATDGHRAKITNPIPADDKTGNAVIIPANIIKWFGKLNAEFFASMDDTQILTTVERVNILCNSIEGPYPHIRAVIPTLFDNEIHINYRDFKKLDAFLDRAKKLVKRTHKFAFIVCSNYIKVNAVDIDSGLEISEILDNSYVTGETPVNIGFDAAYAQQIERKIIKQDKNAASFIIKYNTAISATLWNDNYLLMPVRLYED
jgi:hypothetical protein